MDVGNDCQWLLTSQNKRQPDMMYLVLEVYTTYKTALPHFKPDTDQVSRSNYQFAENTDARETY